MEPKLKKLRPRKCNSQSEKNRNESKDSTKTNMDDFGCSLTYDILRLIFKYLNGRDLSNASMVCRVWKEAIESELALRGPQYLFMNQKHLQSSEQINNVIEEIKIKPSAILLFSNSINFNSETFKDKPYTCLCSYSPRTCDVIHVDGMNPDIRFKNKKAVRTFYSISSFCFPSLRDVNVKTFYCSKETSPKIDQLTIKNLSKSILQHNSNSKKCLIVFCNENTATCGIHKLLDLLRNNINKTSLALIGARFQQVYLCNYRSKPKKRDCRITADIVVVSISKPGLESWSIVIRRNCHEEQQIVDKLTTFRKKIVLQKFTCGLMFACCARIDNKDVEMEAFKKVFPEVPVICGYGDEEYGVDTLDFDQTSKNKNKFYTNYSTIFCIITYS